MNWLWISGWAVPPAWLTAQAQTTWPEGRHVGVSPSDAAQALKTEKFDLLGGYSLGTLWLLRHIHEFSPTLPVILLAPIFAFAVELNRGGRVVRAQLRLQRRHLRLQPAAAIADFFQRAGLPELNSEPQTVGWNSTRLDALDRELGWLEDWRAETPPQHWQGFIGEIDPLLHATETKKFWPKLQVVAHAGHGPEKLMHAAKAHFPGRNA